MLSNEIMGVLALAIVWVNTILIVANALKQAGELRGRLRQMRSVGGDGSTRLFEARVVRGEGRGSALAGHRVEQVGRAGAENGGREAVLFADRSYSGEIYGGIVTAAGQEIAVSPALSGEVWTSAAQVRDAAACPSQAQFDEAYQHARKARGFSRTVEAKIRTDANVWLLGTMTSASVAPRAVDAAAPAWVASDSPVLTPTLVSSVDPRRFCQSRIALLLLSSVGMLLALGGCTALALAKPHFGPASTVGAALCLAFFLLVQPLGTALRDAVRVPSRAIVRGRWIRGDLPVLEQAVAERPPTA